MAKKCIEDVERWLESTMLKADDPATIKITEVYLKHCNKKVNELNEDDMMKIFITRQNWRVNANAEA
jgi:hypothetical protein